LVVPSGGSSDPLVVQGAVLTEERGAPGSHQFRVGEPFDVAAVLEATLTGRARQRTGAPSSEVRDKSGQG
jgi:hypothetical protein